MLLPLAPLCCQSYNHLDKPATHKEWIGKTCSSLLATRQWTRTVRGLFKSLTPNMSNKNSDSKKYHATIVPSHFWIYVIKIVPLSCHPWNSALYRLLGDLWTIFKNDLSEKRHSLKSTGCQPMVLCCKSWSGRHRILVAKEECQWIFTQDRWVEAISFKPVNKTCFCWNWPHVKETWTEEAGKERERTKHAFFPL